MDLNFLTEGLEKLTVLEGYPASVVRGTRSRSCLVCDYRSLGRMDLWFLQQNQYRRYMDREGCLVREVWKLPRIGGSHAGHRTGKDLKWLSYLDLLAQLLFWVPFYCWCRTINHLVSDVRFQDNWSIEIGLGFDGHLFCWAKLIKVVLDRLLQLWSGFLKPFGLRSAPL